MAEEITARQIRGNTWGLFLPRMVVPYCYLTQKEIILLDSGCLTHGEKDKTEVDKYGREALEKNISDAVGVYFASKDGLAKE